MEVGGEGNRVNSAEVQIMKILFILPLFFAEKYNLIGALYREIGKENIFLMV